MKVSTYDQELYPVLELSLPGEQWFGMANAVEVPEVMVRAHREAVRALKYAENAILTHLKASGQPYPFEPDDEYSSPPPPLPGS